MNSAAPKSSVREATSLKAKPARMPASKPCAPSAVQAPPSLLRSAGNMAIQRMVAGPLPLQRKLTIGSVDDPLEHEADRVAEQVMRMPAAREPIGSGAPQVQRKCACGGTCDSCKADEEQWRVQRKSADRPQIAAGASAATTAMSAPSAVHEVLRSPGQPLPSPVRTFFEPRFGADFSQVRVHTDAAAQQSAQDINANAYTAGQNIVFGTGRFAPETQEGHRLLAHELTHVVQQSDGATGSVSRSPQGIVQRQMCTDILDAEEVPGVTRGVEVESAVRVDLIDKLGYQNIVWPLTIPGASSRDYRDEACGGFQSTRPPRSGYPDLAFRQYPRGRTLELAEVKIGTWPCLYLAEQQIDRYVQLADGNEAYKRELGVDRVEVMPTSRLALTQLRHPDNGTPIDVGWCSPGVIVYKAVAEPEEEEEPEEEPEEKEPEDKESDPTDLIPEPIKELGKELAKLLAADGALSVALRFVGSFVALTPLVALAALAVGLVYFWDEIKSVAQWIGDAAKYVRDKISSAVDAIKDKIEELRIKIDELVAWARGLIEDLVEKIVEGLRAAGRKIIEGAEWLGGVIAEGAEAVWDWLFGDDVEPMMPNVELPITEEPTMRCGTVARQDALIQIDSDILFPFGEWELTKLTPEGQIALLKAAAKVLFTPRTDDPVRFFGFTDVIGERNQELSERRAEAVADWFVQLGVVPRDKVETRGLGETEARAPANDEEGRKKDRRVDILVTKKGSSEKVCW